MKSLLLLVCLAICGGCASVRQREAVSLPVPHFESWSFTNGVSCSGAELLSWYYYQKVVAKCGAPGEPQDHGEFWDVDLRPGGDGDLYGRLLIAKDGRKILLEPPTGGFKDSTKQWLRSQRIKYD
jgi:hypothetical protein